MKKKIRSLIACTLAALMLFGCGNYYASVSDKKSVLVQYGDTKITKGDLYDALVAYDAGDSVVRLAAIMVVNAEIETTDEITEQADETMAEYEEYYGDLTTVLDYLGYASEDELYDDVVASVKAEILLENYAEENYDALVEEYNPMKVRIMQFTLTEEEDEETEETEETESTDSTDSTDETESSDSTDTTDSTDDTTEEEEEEETAENLVRAQQALAEVKAGEDFYEVAEKYCDEDDLDAAEETLVTNNDDLDESISEYLATVTTPGLSDVILGEDDETYYIVQVTVTNQEQLKEDFIDYYLELDGISESIFAYYFQLHNFTVYDKTTYDYLVENYPEYLGIEDDE